jgi:hypothetical protein
MQTSTRQKVAHLSLSLTYPDGMRAEFTGEELRAEVTLQLPGLPALDVQDAVPFVMASNEVSRLTIEVLLDLDGRLRMVAHPAPGRSESHDPAES